MKKWNKRRRVTTEANDKIPSYSVAQKRHKMKKNMDLNKTDQGYSPFQSIIFSQTKIHKRIYLFCGQTANTKIARYRRDIRRGLTHKVRQVHRIEYTEWLARIYSRETGLKEISEVQVSNI